MATNKKRLHSWCDANPSSMPHFDSAESLIALPPQHPLCFENLTKNLGGSANRKRDHVLFRVLSVKPYRCSDGERCETLLVRCRMEAPIISFGGPDLPPPGVPGWSGWNGATEECESMVSAQFLNGTLVARNLALLFKRADHASPLQASSWRLRGIHAGDFVWTCTDKTGSRSNGVTVTGRLAGTNSTGLVRSPAMSFDDDKAKHKNMAEYGCGKHLTECCTESCNAPFLHGRLDGVVRVAPRAKMSPVERKRLDCAHIVGSYRISYDPNPSRKAPFAPRWGTVGRGVLHGAVMLNCGREVGAVGDGDE